MRVPASFAFLVPLLSSAAVVACGPSDYDDDWTAGSCYCDDYGCHDYNNDPCEPPSGGASSGRPGGGGSSSGTTSSSGGETDGGGSSSGETSSSSGSPGASSGSGSSSGTTSSGGSSSGETSSSGGSTSSSGGSSSSSGGPSANCTIDADCGQNQTCLGGFCRFQCTSDEQCRLYDSRLRTCDQGICRQN